MKSKALWLGLVTALLVVPCAGAAAEEMGTAFTYQGELTDDGIPVDGTCDFEFNLYDALTDGTHVAGPVSKPEEPVTNGRFTVSIDFGTNTFTGDARWLEIAVCCPSPCAPADRETLTPRQELTPAPHALALVGLWTQQNATSPNLIGGYNGNTVEAGAVGVTIGGGGAAGGGGRQCGGPNHAWDDWASVAGGSGNEAGTDDGDPTNQPGAAVGGGCGNAATGEGAAISGGQGNVASGIASTVAGGHYNDAINDGASVGGGADHWVAGFCATVAGGDYNMATGDWATVGGGARNSATEMHATIGGGDQNDATEWYATVGGGDWNDASGAHATVGGGSWNGASGGYATVPGGANNAAAGGYSLAAGRRAKAYHTGAFVWADSTDADFASSADDQFLIRATGGVGIETNSPQAKLHVGGTAGVDGIMFPDGTLQTTAATAVLSAWSLTGNAGTSPPANFLGTTDNQALEIHVNGGRALRIEPDATSPNLIGGYSDNGVTAGVIGATISGGGESGGENRVTDDYGTVGGGEDNQAGDNESTTTSAHHATVGGGDRNAALEAWSTIGGGVNNTAGQTASTVGGGIANTAGGANATVGGGQANTANGQKATVAGGYYNTASGWAATVGGGGDNLASNTSAMVPGGAYNVAGGECSFAAGRQAKADNDGMFVWSDFAGYLDFPSVTEAEFTPAANQFLVRATGGVVFVTEIDPVTGDAVKGVELRAGEEIWEPLSLKKARANSQPADATTLHESAKEKDTEIEALRRENAQLGARVAALEQAVAALTQQSGQTGGGR